jgi:hypothetical protein
MPDEDGPRLITTKLDAREDLYDSMRSFFKAGR